MDLLIDGTSEEDRVDVSVRFNDDVPIWIGTLNFTHKEWSKFLLHLVANEHKVGIYIVDKNGELL